MLQGQELALAINAAFSYVALDSKLKQALEGGRLKTKEDIKREVTRILGDDSIRKPAILRFFRSILITTSPEKLIRMTTF